jgi:hypothetical protein
LVPLAVADVKAVYGLQHSINEKNWMPFVWQVGAAYLVSVLVVVCMALCVCTHKAVYKAVYG